MTIVPVGNLILQALEGDHLDFVRSLIKQIDEFKPKIIQRVLDASLEAEIDAWFARGRYVRRRKSNRQEGRAYCSRCLSHQRRNFRRNGHYVRSLVTCEGKIQVNIPQVKCKCGGNVKMTFKTIRSRQRIWDDVGLEVQVDYGQGLSYRQIKANLDEQIGTSFGLRTLNRQVLRGAADEIVFNFLGWETVPPVVRMDGIWITVMFPTGQSQRDARGRQRPVKCAKRIPVLAAQGVWPTTGRTTLIAWMLAEGEDMLSWQKFLEQLYLAGLTPENGLAMLAVDGSAGFKAAYENVYWKVPLQRCVFHKLRNAARTIRTPADLDRQAAHEYRTQFLRQAARIWQAPDEHEARLLHATFCKTWQAHQPKAVQTLVRDLDETLTFYAVQQAAADQGQLWSAHLLRTTSPLERMFREFRRRYRGALLFHSTTGAQAVTAQIATRFS